MITKRCYPLSFPGGGRQPLKLLDDAALCFLKIPQIPIKETGHPVGTGLARIDYRISQVGRQDLRKITGRAGLPVDFGKR